VAHTPPRLSITSLPLPGCPLAVRVFSLIELEGYGFGTNRGCKTDSSSRSLSSSLFLPRPLEDFIVERPFLPFSTFSPNCEEGPLFQPPLFSLFWILIPYWVSANCEFNFLLAFGKFLLPTTPPLVRRTLRLSSPPPSRTPEKRASPPLDDLP